jgi:3-(3-hydroxy-phenyl)propionate hydroxylase
VHSDGQPGWLLRQTGSGRFTALLFAGGMDAAAQARSVAALHEAAEGLVALQVLRIVPAGAAVPPALDGTTTLVDRDGLLAERYDAQPGTTYLLRPDQHVCARWRSVAPAAARAALRRALALPMH